MVERRQQIIAQFLKKTISNISEQKYWSHKVPELQTIINSTTSSARNYSTFFLTFLKHPNFPFQTLRSAKPNYSDQSMLTARFNFNLSNQLVKECVQALEESFQKAKASFDSHSTPRKLAVGDIVYIVCIFVRT